MKLRDFLWYFPDYIFTKDQFAYADYLERCGMRFLVDFGFENAEQIAWDELESETYLLGHA